MQSFFYFATPMKSVGRKNLNQRPDNEEVHRVLIELKSQLNNVLNNSCSDSNHFYHETEHVIIREMGKKNMKAIVFYHLMFMRSTPHGVKSKLCMVSNSA